MYNNYSRLLMMFLSLYFIYGCATLLHYPPVEKKLFSWQIPKDQIETIKTTISSNGYERITKDNYPYEGAIVTQYAKEISTPKINSRVQIMLSFKETCLEKGSISIKEVPCPDNVFYRNLGITISNLDRNDIHEINDEVNRIEEVLYKKLIEVAGEKNVVRGERK